MRIASVTMAGPGTEAIIGDALQSARSLVDAWVIFGTGINANEVPHPMWDWLTGKCADGPEVNFIEGMTWRDDFAAMRNLALDEATECEAEWAVWLDTDERLIVPDPALLREELAAQPHTVSALRAWSIDGSYAKERFVRLPRQGEYVGPTHEYWASAKGTTVGVSLAARFDELPKDPESEAFKAKLARDKRILEAHIAQHKEARWLFYLSETHNLLGDIDEAIRGWEEAIKSPGHGEIRAWAAFRAASALIEKGDYKRAKQIAMTGLMVYPHGSELFWVIGEACNKLGQYHDAIQWAMHAGAAGSYLGWGREVNRTGFIWPPANWYMPYETLAHAYARTGAKQLAKMADKTAKEAKAAMGREMAVVVE